MGRAKNYLSNKERIVYETHLHWVLFIESVSYLVIALLISAAAYKYGGEYAKLIHYISLPFWLYGGVKVFLEWIQHASADFIITNSRVILKVGVLKRSSLSIPLTKIESIEIDQTLIGQLLGFGTIHITGTGTATSKFEYISSPGTFRQRIQQATNALESENHESLGDEEISSQEKISSKPPVSYRKRVRRR